MTVIGYLDPTPLAAFVAVQLMRFGRATQEVILKFS